jgi:glycosyltransferase involved in cell wall biosynthesis
MSKASAFNDATQVAVAEPAQVFPGPADIRAGESGVPIRALAFLEADKIAGAVKPVLEFAREAARSTTRRMEVDTAVFVRGEPRSELIDAVHEQNIPVDILLERGPFDLHLIPQLHRIVHKRRPDIIWTNNTKSHFLVRFSGLHRVASWVAFHHGYTQDAWRTQIYNQLDRWSLPAAQRVVTVCEQFARDLQQRGVPEARISVQQNPIRLQSPVTGAEKLRLRSKLCLPDNARVLLSIGRLSKEKGHADLLRAMSHLRAGQNGRSASSLHLLLVGNGPEEAALHALRAELRLDDVVHLTGYQSDVRPYYAISDLFVLPSHSEGSPNVLLEAMAAEVPTVATAVGGIPEVLKNEVNALLVPKKNVVELSAAIERLLNDPMLRQRFTEHGKQVVAQHDPPSYFDNISHIFEEVLLEACAA